MSTQDHPRKKRFAVVAILATVASIGAWAAISNGVFSNGSPSNGSLATSASPSAAQTAAASQNAAPPLNFANKATKARDARQRAGAPEVHIVVFDDAPLATYQGEVAGIARPARKGNGRGRVDVANAQSRAYVRYLQDRQQGYEARIDNALGRQVKVTRRMQHALNAIVTTLSPAEADEVSRLPDVRLVEAYREYEQDTDVGPYLIGADKIWQGISRPLGDGPDRARGEGVVVGIIDSGINFGSPSFAAVDPLDGYVHVNPNGSGNYLGTCAPGGVDAGRCNDKLIGGYDFVCGAPGNACANAALREEPGFGDTNGHGSHTASTAAGNSRHENFNGSFVTISGVAPRANLIAYDVCYTELATGRGLCPNVSAAAAVNQAIADGVDVINFSIGGGVLPWNEAVSLAFLNATDAGIFVAASAGNSGPGAGTLGHVEPWVTSSAAVQHGRAGFTVLFSVTGPGTPPAALQSIQLTAGSGGVSLSGPVANAPVVVSLTIDSANDGCTALPPDTFKGAIALIRRGGCPFSDKAINAANAGARLLIIANNTPGLIAPSAPGATIPVFAMTQTESNAVRDFFRTQGSATGSVMPVVLHNVPDALADFSSRGPATFDLLKPDVSAPGVAILAAYAGTTISGSESLLATISGTSMASPHTAGAAALMRQMHPAWTVPEIKSALMMTASRTVLLEDETTPANALAGGAGRLQVDHAARAGLVLNEIKARYMAANPILGGDPSALNLASIQHSNCSGRCVFFRTVRNTLAVRAQWKAELAGLEGNIAPAIINLKPGESRQIRITVNNRAAAGDGSWRFGSLELTPFGRHGDATLPALHMPLAVRVPPPPPPAIPLVSGVPTGVAGAAGSSTFYRLVVPRRARSVSFTLSGGTGDADMYVKWGEAPLVSFDCASAGNGNNETCTMAARPGTYYVRIDGYTAYTGATLTAAFL